MEKQNSATNADKKVQMQKSSSNILVKQSSGLTRQTQTPTKPKQVPPESDSKQNTEDTATAKIRHPKSFHIRAIS